MAPRGRRRPPGLVRGDRGDEPRALVARLCRRGDGRVARPGRPRRPRRRCRNQRRHRAPRGIAGRAALVRRHRRLVVPGLRAAVREPERRRSHPGDGRRRSRRLALRLARHQRLHRSRVHPHPRQQRPRLHRRRREQRGRSGQRPRRRGRPRLRLPAGPDAGPADLPPDRRDQPVLLEQHHARRLVRVRVRRGGGQLPGHELRRCRRRRRRRARGGPGRQRHQQRELRHAGPERGQPPPSHADVRLDAPAAEHGERGRRRRGRGVRGVAAHNSEPSSWSAGRSSPGRSSW